MIELGSEVRDKVTGLTGIAICRSKWLTGCDTIMVQPKVDKDGKVPESRTIDEPTLEVIQEPDFGPIPGGGG